MAQDVEEEMLLANKRKPADVQLHRTLLSLATAAGEGLLLEVDDATLAPLGIGVESIVAKLQSLRMTFEQLHTEANLPRQAAILQEAFGVSA
jgi:hypothetical protein